MVTKSRQFKKLKCREGSQLCKLSQLCYHFLSRFENENIFFDIPSNLPPIAVRNSLTNQFYQKKLTFLYIFNNNKKVTSFSGTLLFSSVLHFSFCWKYTELSIFFEKLLGQWIPDCDGRGIARDIKKSIFIFKTRQKIVTELGQFTKLGPFSTFQLFELSKLGYHFLSSFENGNILLLISLAIPHPSRSGIHWSINFSN